MTRENVRVIRRLYDARLADDYDTVFSTFDNYRPEVEQITDVGGGRVLTLAIEHGVGRGSGARVQAARTAHLWTLRDGKAVQVDLFLDRSQAAAAIGSSH